MFPANVGVHALLQQRRFGFPVLLQAGQEMQRVLTDRAKIGAKFSGFQRILCFIAQSKDLNEEVVMIAADLVRLPGDRGGCFIHLGKHPAVRRPGAGAMLSKHYLGLCESSR